MRGTVKKLMLNMFEMCILNIFLSHVDEWSINFDVQILLDELCPDVIHVNDPTCPKRLK